MISFVMILNHRNGGIMKKNIIIYLIGSFVFAFLLGELVHEFGHYLLHVIYNHEGVYVVIDPFGGSRNAGVTSMPMNEVAWTTIMGPMTNVLLATIFYFVFLKLDFLPIKIWMPVALIQEGVTFSIGMLTNGGDAYWISESTGIPPLIIVLIGVFFLCLGIWRLAKEMSRIGIIRDATYKKRLTFLFFSLGSLMIIRALHSFFVNPDLIIENTIPLIFSVLVAAIVAALVNKKSQDNEIKLHKVYAALIMGILMFVLQIIF